MQRSITYAVWRGTNCLRGTVKGSSSLSARIVHTSDTSATQAAPEQNTHTPATDSSERLSENDAVAPNFVNRNPRNLERMAVAKKDHGWSQSHPSKAYWHKLYFEKSNRHIKAYIQHCDGSVILSASTKEWAIKKYLYSTADVAAAQNIGRILAQRCLECGISYVHYNIDSESKSFERVKVFLDAMKEGGVVLNEPKYIVDFRQPIDYFPEDY